MLAQIEIAPTRIDRCNMQCQHVTLRKLVIVASEHFGSDGGRGRPNEPIEAGPTVGGQHGLQCTRIAARTVSGSAAWCRRRGRQIQVSPRFVDPIGAPPGLTADLPANTSGILQMLDREEGARDDRAAIAGAIAALRAADVVIAGPLSSDDANSPGLLPHLADLSSGAYRALRPPRELLLHPAFAQVARRFQYIQMSHHQARALGAGASDIGTLAQRLRQLQGDLGEFAITSFTRTGLLWADDAWWEIEPIGCDGAKESVAESVFCTAWVVARWFRDASAPEALAFARAAAARAINPARRNRFPSE
jgi:hypothetical protein